MGEEAFFDAGIFPEGIDEAENLIAADHLQDEAEEAIGERTRRNGDVADAMAAFEKADDEAAGPDAFLDVADALHALAEVGVHGIGSDDDDIGLALDRALGKRTGEVDSGAVGVDGVSGKERANLERLVHDGVDDEDLFSEELGGFLEVEPHGTHRAADVIVFVSTDALHVVLTDGARGGETGEKHLATAAEAEEEMRFDGADGDDEIGLGEMVIERDISAPRSGAKMLELPFVAAGVVMPRDAAEIGVAELLARFIGGHIPMNAEGEENRHVLAPSAVSEEIVEERVEKPSGGCRTADVVDTKDDAFVAQVPVAQGDLFANGMIEGLAKRRSDIGDFGMRRRTDGIDDLPATGKGERDFLFFKWKRDCGRHRSGIDCGEAGASGEGGKGCLKEKGASREGTRCFHDERRPRL